MTEDASADEQSTVTDQVTVDSFVPDVWPKEIVAALATWKQGDLIANPIVTWAGTATDDEITGAAAGSFNWEAVVSTDLVVPYGIITSQTCDIGGTGPGSKHPFVEVAPVVAGDKLDKSKQQQIQQYKITYQVALPKPPTAGFWLADLRLIVPASKQLLLTSDPIDAFGDDEQARLNFAEMLAVKRRRPAVHAAISEALPQSLEEYIAQTMSAKDAPPADWYEKVDQVRVQLTGDRLAPQQARLIVVPVDDLTAAERELWRGCFKRGKKLLAKDGIELRTTQFQSLDKMTARTYASSLPVRVITLGRPPNW